MHEPDRESPPYVSLRCPECGGSLGPPFSLDVHCFVDCTGCRRRFELDDPALAGASSPPKGDP
jgi:hypothetical protein